MKTKLIKCHAYVPVDDIRLFKKLIDRIRDTQTGRRPLGQVIGAIFHVFTHDKEFQEKVKDVL